MPYNGLPLTREQIETLRGEYRQLLEASWDPAEAKKVIAERWRKSMVVIRHHLNGIKPPQLAIAPFVLDAVGVDAAASVGKVSFGPAIDPSPAPTMPPVFSAPVSTDAGSRAPSFIPSEGGYLPHTDIAFKPVDQYGSPSLSGVKTYILTGWEIRVKPHYGFIDCLRQVAKQYDASLYLTPHYLPDLDFLPNELRSSFQILTDDLHFNDNCFFKYVETHALNVSPLMGWKGFSDKTAILPGLIKELETLPTDKDCKQLITTGSVGHFTLDSEHYRFITDSSDGAYKKRFESRWNSSRSQKKPIAIACEYVMPSALIVHVLDDKRFLTRRLSMQPGSDCVYDLGWKFTAGKKKPEKSRPRFLNVGDTHSWFADPNAITATLEQIDALRPREIILNDFTDGISANHHEKDRAFTYHQAPPIRTEIEYTTWMLRSIVERAHGARVVYRHSNHDDFFEKFLDAGEKYWRMNYNYDVAINLQQQRGTTDKHPIELLIDFPSLGVTFSPDRASHMHDRVSVIHGHETISGRRVGFKELVKHYNYVCVAHSHSPKEWRNGMMAGLTGIRNMPYADGSLGGWLHANVVGFDDGSMQMLPIIAGTWTV